MTEKEFNRQLQDLFLNVVGFAVHLTRDRDRGYDLAQDTFVKALRARGSFDEAHPEGMRAWLFTIAKNTHVSDIRKARRRSAECNADRLEDRRDIACGTPPPDRGVELKDMKKALAAIDVKMRVALVATELLGGRTEAAEALGLPQGTLRAQASRGRAKLRALLP